MAKRLGPNRRRIHISISVYVNEIDGNRRATYVKAEDLLTEMIFNPDGAFDKVMEPGELEIVAFSSGKELLK